MTTENTNLTNEELIIEGVNFGAAAKTLASGMAGLADPPFNVLGATLISALWPTSDKGTTDWQNVYTELQTIVQNGLEAQTVQTAKDQLNGYLLYIKNDYLPAKKTPKVTKKKLFDKLQRQSYNQVFFSDIVSVFQHDTNSEKSAAALANFMLGANLQLALNQELAINDPSVTNPNHSQYANTIKALCKSYRTYALKAGANVFTSRGDQVTHCAFHERTHYGAPPDQWYSFTDNHDAYTSPNYPNKASCNSAWDSYTSGVDNAMNETLQAQVYDTLNHWLQLVITPVPTYP